MPTGQKLPTVEVSEHSHGAGAEGAGAQPVSKLHGFASTDVADFAIPHGREEEWRFTPLDRLRGCQLADPAMLQELKKLRASLDPFKLSQIIEQKLNRIF